MKKLLFKFLPLLAVTILLISCGSSNKKEEQNTNATKTDVKKVYDVSSLVGKNIDEIRSVLGKPSDEEIEPTKQQMEMNFDSWDNNFDKDGKTLLITFNPQDRKVIDFFISTDDPSGTTDDYSDLLKICNVTDDNSAYKIEPVPTIKDDTRFTGIKIVPN